MRDSLEFSQHRRQPLVRTIFCLIADTYMAAMAWACVRSMDSCRKQWAIVRRTMRAHAHLQFFQGLLFVGCKRHEQEYYVSLNCSNKKMAGCATRGFFHRGGQTPAAECECQKKNSFTTFEYFSNSAWAWDNASFESMDSSITAASAALTAVSCF